MSQPNYDSYDHPLLTDKSMLAKHMYEINLSQAHSFSKGRNYNNTVSNIVKAIIRGNELLLSMI